MNYSVCYRPSLPPSASPYRLLDDQGYELAWANSFLDAQRLRRLSVRSLRAYAFCISSAGRNSPWPDSPKPPCSSMSAINWTSNPNPHRKP
jgi:hypothetical protein